MPLLPPPKQRMDPADAEALVAYADGFVWQTTQATSAYRATAERNYNLYLGHHWTEVAPDEAAARYVFNRIKTIVISHVAIQTNTTAKVKLLPRNSGRKGNCFIDTQVWSQIQTHPEVAALAAIIPQQCLAMSPLVPAPLPRAVYEQIDAMIQQGQQIAQQAMLAKAPPPFVLPEELIAEVNDETTCDAVQTLFDALWSDSNADHYVVLDALYNGIVGWSNMYYRWDDQAERHLLHNAEFPQVYMEHSRTDISACNVATFDFVCCEEQGMAEFPDLAKEIDDRFSAGTVMPPGAWWKFAAVYTGNTFWQKMGCIRKCWIRKQPYPMSPQEALDRKLVVMGYPAPTGKGMADGQGMSVGSADAGGGSGLAHAAEPGDDTADGAVAGDSGSVDGAGGGAGATESPADAGQSADTGTQLGGGAAPGGVSNGTMGTEDSVGAAAGTPIEPPTAYILLVNGQPAHEVKPWGPGWPMRRGIRELTIITSKLVDDRECPDAELPLTHNVNFPRLHGPHGQGTPEDLELLNMAVNEIISNLVWLTRKAAFGTTLVADSLEKTNPDIGKQAFMRPGTILTAPDNTMKELKLLLQTIDPPRASEDVWRFLTQLLDLIDKQGDMAQVLQGQVANLSGDAIGKLQGAAQGSVVFRGRRSERMLEHLAELMLGGISRMSIEGMCDAVPGTPPYLWAEFKHWFVHNLRYDVDIEVASGGAATKQVRAQQIQAACGNVPLQVSQKTRFESLELNADKEAQQNVEWNAEMQPALPQGQPVAPGGGGAVQSPPQGA